MKYVVRINKKTGAYQFLGDAPPGLRLPNANRSRFSEVIPVRHAWIFRVLRWIFGEKGKVAAWTRVWRGDWVGTILQGPNKGRSARSRDRALLLEWEQHVWRNKI